MKRWLLDISLAALFVWSVSVLASVTVKPVIRAVIAPETTAAKVEAAQRQIGVLRSDAVEYMSMSDYLTGVLLCEIPADFHHEAKCAQAIVARTYALRTAMNGKKHGQNIICARPECCQGFIPKEEYLQKWGANHAVIAAQEAVTATKGLVLLYEKELIDATYFSCSGGTTEDAQAVWGADVPYLQSVESPGEEAEEEYLQTLRFTPEEFCERLGLKLTGRPADWLGEVVRSEGGGVSTIRIYDTQFSGTQMRKLLELPSTWFYISSTADSILVTTRGFGHRVGMSQYGADAMACAGSSYEEIVKHYYTGVELAVYE